MYPFVSSLNHAIWLSGTGTISEEEREQLRQAAKERAEIVLKYDKVGNLCCFSYSATIHITSQYNTNILITSSIDFKTSQASVLSESIADLIMITVNKSIQNRYRPLWSLYILYEIKWDNWKGVDTWYLTMQCMQSYNTVLCYL